MSMYMHVDVWLFLHTHKKPEQNHQKVDSGYRSDRVMNDFSFFFLFNCIFYNDQSLFLQITPEKV
jgi:hypothetical protein